MKKVSVVTFLLPFFFLVFAFSAQAQQIRGFEAQLCPRKCERKQCKRFKRNKKKMKRCMKTCVKKCIQEARKKLKQQRNKRLSKKERVKRLCKKKRCGGGAKCVRARGTKIRVKCVCTGRCKVRRGGRCVSACKRGQRCERVSVSGTTGAGPSFGFRFVCKKKKKR